MTLVIKRRAGGFCAVLSWLFLCPCLGAQQFRSKIDKYSEDAERALASRNLPKAEIALQQLATLTPSVASVHAQLGLVYYMENRYAQAAESFRQALQLNPHLPNASVMLGICISEVGRYSDAIPLLAPYFRSSKGGKMGRLVGLGLLHAYGSLNRYSEADRVSEELMKMYPRDPEILYHASSLYGDQSLYLIVHLMKTAPDSVWVYLVFAKVNEDEKRYDAAIAEYRLALKMSPRLPGIHFNLGRALFMSSDSDRSRKQALQEFQQELAIDPQNSRADYEIGEIYRRGSELDKARLYFERAVRLNPQFEESQIALGRTLIDLKQPREAIPYLLTAVGLNPANAVSHFLLARAYSELGDSPNSKRELALFRKYRIQPYSNSNGPAFQLSPDLTTPDVTLQTLDPGPPRR